ncbi:MAG TPA: VOC family protein [Pseudolabrys sp.]|nr:VOC family protein [Pseudolabrys sp.]
MYLQPYLFFDGHTEEALDFYKKAVGAEVKMLMRFKEAPDQSMVSKGSENKVMHAHFKVGDTDVLISDGRNQGNPKFEGFALTLQAKDETEAAKFFNALGQGGEIGMPLGKTFFAKSFGMLKDKFGVNWMVIAN